MNHEKAYLILSVEYGSSLEKCTESYKTLRLAFHPDKNSGKLQEKFTEVQNAMDFLRKNPTAPNRTTTGTKRPAPEDSNYQPSRPQYSPEVIEQLKKYQGMFATIQPQTKPTIRTVSLPAEIFYTGGIRNIKYSRFESINGYRNERELDFLMPFKEKEFQTEYTFRKGGDICKGKTTENPLTLKVKVEPSYGWEYFRGIFEKKVFLTPEQWKEPTFSFQMPDGKVRTMHTPMGPKRLEIFRKNNYVLEIVLENTT